MSILGFTSEMIKVYIINRKGKSSHFSHLENHCHYGMQHHCKHQSTPVKYPIFNHLSGSNVCNFPMYFPLKYEDVIFPGSHKGTKNGFLLCRVFTNVSSLWRWAIKDFKVKATGCVCKRIVQVLLRVSTSIWSTRWQSGWTK